MGPSGPSGRTPGGQRRAVAGRQAGGGLIHRNAHRENKTSQNHILAEKQLSMISPKFTQDCSDKQNKI